MFAFLKKLFYTEPELPTGALLDVRKPERKINDIAFQDIVATASPVSWVTKTQYRTFPTFNQNRTLSCGAHALAKALGIAYNAKYGVYVPFSRTHIYQRRITRSGGMALWEMFDILGAGVTLEQLTPEPFNTDEDIDKITIEQFKKDVGAVFKVTGGIYLPSDIEQIASVIQTTGKGVILLTYFLSKEWSSPSPIIQNRILGVNDPSALKHFVVAVDFTLINGIKYLVIEDSAWFGGYNRRTISEDWVKNRVIGAGYPMNFKFAVGTDNRPTYDGWTITSVQQCLRYEGLFPTNVSLTENVGPVTRKALSQFQVKYGLPVTSQIDTSTKMKLKTLYP